MSGTDTRSSACRHAGQGLCQAYGPGHNLHSIHARKIGESPWGWRDGVVVEATNQGFVTIEYALEPGRVEAWHHDPVVGKLPTGSPVRVHEGFYVLSSALGWVNLLVSSGLGAVPTPDETDLWQGEVTGGVVDLSTGRGVALDHPDRRTGQDRPGAF